MEWTTGEYPQKPCECLCTIYDDSAMENIVVPCTFICKPYQGRTGFLHGDELLTNEVIAWMEFPKPFTE